MPTQPSCKPSIDKETNVGSSSDPLRDPDNAKDGIMDRKPLVLRKVPEELDAEVEKVRSAQRFCSKRQQDEFEVGVRLRIFYGGEVVACMSTPNGVVVLAHVTKDEASLWNELKQMPQAERAKVEIVFPEPWTGEPEIEACAGR
jgi:hypothetical protein